MAASKSHVFLLLFGIILLAELSALVRAELPEEGIKTENLHLSTQDADKDDHELETRGLFDNSGLTSLHNTVVSSGSSLSNFGNTYDGIQDISGAFISAGKDGTRNSFNKRGKGVQNFKGAKIHSGGTDGTSDSFNNFGSGDQNFSGAEIDSGGETGGASTGDDQNVDVVNSFNGLNFPGNMGPNTITWMGTTIEHNENGLTLHGVNSGNDVVSIRNNQVFVGNKLVCKDIKKLTDKPTYQKSADGVLWYANVKIGDPMSKAEIEKFKAEWAQHVKEQEERKREHEQRMADHEKRMEEHRKRMAEHKQGMAGANSEDSGTQDSFNNKGPGVQNFKGAKFNTGKTTDSFNFNGGGTIDLSGATINSGAGSGDDQNVDVVNSFNGLNFSGNMGANTITWMGTTIEYTENGLTLHGVNSGNDVVSIRNNQVFVGNKLVCKDIKKLTDKPTYQKSADGVLWYANVKIGDPMSKAEIEKFKADWAQHVKEQEERKREHEQRMAEHEQRMEEHRQRMAEHGKRMAEHKQRMTEHKQRMAEHKQRMAEQRKEQRLKRQAEEREKRLKKQAEARERRAKQASPGRASSFW